MAKRNVKSTNRPVPPKDFNEAEAAAWEAACDDLEAKGSLGKTDRALIELYARTYALFTRIATELRGDDLTRVCNNGRLFINPLVTAYATVAGKLNRIVLDLGLSSKGTEQLPPDNPWSKLANGQV